MNNRLIQLFTDSTHPDAWRAFGEMLLRVGSGVAAALLVLFIGRGFVKFTLKRIFGPLIKREEPENPARAARLVTLQTVIRSVLMYALYFIVLIMLLGAIGINTASLFATAGVAGVAIGFGSQKIVRDVVTGFLLLLEDQFSVGDVVSIGGNTGAVVETGMRITKLLDETGRLIILSNGDISQVINYSKGAFRIAVEVTVAADAPPEKIAEAVTAAEAALKSSSSHIDKVQLVGTIALAAVTTTYRVEANAPPTERLESEAALRAELRAALAQHEIPLA